MEILQVSLFIIIFMLMAAAMFFRKIPALLALPVLAFVIPLIAGVSVNDTIEFVIGEGALKLHNAYTVALFGSMLSVFLQRTRVAESFIKKGAELSGDNPWTIAVLMLLLIMLLFTTLGGLGAIIMVATVVLPILSSVGVGPLTVVGIFLIALSIGGTLNAGNWAVYVDVMQLSVAEIRTFALIMFGLTFIAGLIYITIQLYRDGHELRFRKIIVYSLTFFGGIFLLILFYIRLDVATRQFLGQIVTALGQGLKWSLAGLLSLLYALAIIRIFRRPKASNEITGLAYFTPLLPLILILIFDLNFIAAFIAGLVYGFLATWRPGSLNLLIQSVLEGGALVMPALVLMLGIGMLLNAIMGPGSSWLSQHPEGWPVLNLLRPLLLKIIPQHPVTYVFLFGLAAPLALYRGPLNVWGMGYGLAAVLLASGMPAGAVMGLLLAVGPVQGISDPTNTHNVWLANEMQQDVQKVLWNTLPYAWGLAWVGLILAAVMFYS